ncbi:hypothetical protein PV326_007894, partial [Microctonus aethiopoides]
MANSESETKQIIHRGKPKSERVRKESKKRFSSIIKTKGLRLSLEKKKKLREVVKSNQAQSRAIIEQKKSDKEEKKQRRIANLKRAEENRKKSEVVQVVNYVVQEAIVVIKDIFRKYPNKYESIISTLYENLDKLDEPAEAGVSMIWIIGEYTEGHFQGTFTLLVILFVYSRNGQISMDMTFTNKAMQSIAADQIVQKMQQNNVFTIVKRNVKGQDMLYQSLKLTNNVGVLNELKIQSGNPDVTLSLKSRTVEVAGGVFQSYN